MGVATAVPVCPSDNPGGDDLGQHPPATAPHRTKVWHVYQARERDHSPITAALADLVRQGADADSIGERVAQAWRAIDARLNPVIGTQGVAALYAQSRYLCDFRESLRTFVKVLKSEGVTLVLTSELEDRYTDLRFSPCDTAFLTDAIIVQRYIEVESRLRRVLAVVKVRSSQHSDELREYRIDGSGICIGDTLVDQEGLLGGQANPEVPMSQHPSSGLIHELIGPSAAVGLHRRKPGTNPWSARGVRQNARVWC